MIQETNYCAHAVDDMQRMIRAGAKIGESSLLNDMQYLTTMCMLIKSAQLFRLPDYGKIFSFKTTNVLEIIRDYCGGELRLPYPIVALEYAHPKLRESNNGIGTTEFEAVIAVAHERIEQGQRVIIVSPLCRATNGPATFGNKKIWVPVNFSARISLNDGINFAPCLTWGIDFVKKNGDSAAIELACADTQNEVGAVIGLMAALACRNVSASEHKPPAGLNKKRIQAGKQPFFSYRVLNITNDAKTDTSRVHGAHASPRVHLRRGHIRRLPDRSIWVNASVVGNKSLGMVRKDYAVAAAAQPKTEDAT